MRMKVVLFFYRSFYCLLMQLSVAVSYYINNVFIEEKCVNYSEGVIINNYYERNTVG